MSEGFLDQGAPAEMASEPERPYTPEEITRLTFGLYRFSQGGIVAQFDIASYLGLEYGHRATDEAIDAAVPTTAERLAQYLEKDKGRSHKDAPVTASQEASELRMLYDTYWKPGRELPPEEMPRLARRLLQHSLERDELFIITRGGRERATEREESSHARPNSRFMSQFVFYGLQAHSTGSSEFDGMFRNMVTALGDCVKRLDSADPAVYDQLEADDKSDARLVSMTRRVVGAHLNHYPDDKESIPKEWWPVIGVDDEPHDTSAPRENVWL